MSYTGTYRFNKKTGRVEKISDDTPNVGVFDCYVPQGGYYSENLQTFVQSRKHKREIMRQQGLRETNDRLSKREI